jgi:hypothetical protein
VSELWVSRKELGNWAHRVLDEMEGRDDEELAQGYWGEDERLLNVREVRERMRALLTRLAVERR